MDDSDKDLVQWFFARLRMIYGNRFLTTYPDDNALKMAKREWAEQIIRRDRKELDLAFSSTKEKMIDGDQDAKWPDPAYVLGQCINSGSPWA